MIRSTLPHLQVATQTHPGMTGKVNEDRMRVTSYRMSSSNPTPVTFAVICDGIGGHQSGEIAAELAVEIITNTVGKSFGDRPLKTMLLGIQLSNEAIYSQAQGSEDKKGMGATVAMAWVAGNKLFTTCIGDSRIYLVRENQIRQVSTDHTWIQEALEKGTISKEEAVNHPNAHVIRRYLGAPIMPQADQRLRLRNNEDDNRALSNQGVELRVGDSILLCSDGLTDHVTDYEIANFIGAPLEPIQGAVDKMVELACERGGHDNISIILLKLPPNEPKGLIGKVLSKIGM